MEDQFGEILYNFKKNASEIVGAGFSTFKEKEYFYLRVFIPSNSEPDEIIATKKGLSLPVETLEEVLNGLQMLDNVMSNDKVVKKIPLGNKKECWIGIKPFKENAYVFIQIYQQFGKELSHTNKAVFVGLNKHEELKKTIQTLIDARAKK
jgi:hypothetical protein